MPASVTGHITALSTGSGSRMNSFHPSKLAIAISTLRHEASLHTVANSMSPTRSLTFGICAWLTTSTDHRPRGLYALYIDISIRYAGAHLAPKARS